MATALAYEDIRKEFEESLGYIQNDIRNVRRSENSINYGLALLIGCGCEVLAAGRGNRNVGHKVLEELLDGEWKLLAKPLFEALRNGLVHSFDTKYLRVDGQDIQIALHWWQEKMFAIEPGGLVIGVKPLGERLCRKIDEFRVLLQADGSARVKFKAACEHQEFAGLGEDETAAWKRLMAMSGIVVKPVIKR